MTTHARRVAALVAIVAACTLTTSVSAHGLLGDQIDAITDDLEHDPDNIALLLERVMLYGEEGDYEAALADLHRALHVSPETAEVFLAYGEVYYALGRFDDARAHLTAFIEMSGGTMVAFWLRGLVYEDDGDFDLAVRDYASAVTLGDNPDLFLTQARLLVRLDRVDEAVAGLRAALERTPSTAVRIELFDVEMTRGDFDAAIALCDEALAHARVGTRWLVRRAEALAGAGRTDEAESALQDALDEADRMVWRRGACTNHVDRARVHFALGNFTEAEHDIEIAEGRCGNNPYVQSEIAEIQGVAR